MYRDIPEDLLKLVEPIVKDHGLELIDLDVSRGRVPWGFRVIVDTAAGDGRVAIDRCVAVSREIETHLDAAESIPEQYRLEVTSPGLDRRLAREVDFERACGSTVKVETSRPVDGLRKFRGELLAFENQRIRLKVDEKEIEILFDEISKAKVVYEFSGEDFGKSGKKK